MHVRVRRRHLQRCLHTWGQDVQWEGSPDLQRTRDLGRRARVRVCLQERLLHGFLCSWGQAVQRTGATDLQR